MNENVTVFSHPLIKHKISQLMDETCKTKEFRALVEEISMLMGYEVLRDLEMEEIEIKTPMETTTAPIIKGKKLALVPILRAGLGMTGGILSLVPSAKVGHVGCTETKRRLNPKNITANCRKGSTSA